MFFYLLEFWSINHTSIHENSGLKVSKKMKFFGKISNKWPNGLLGTNVYKTLDNDNKSFI